MARRTYRLKVNTAFQQKASILNSFQQPNLHLGKAEYVLAYVGRKRRTVERPHSSTIAYFIRGASLLLTENVWNLGKCLQQ